jgi:hypothetical protein
MDTELCLCHVEEYVRGVAYCLTVCETCCSRVCEVDVLLFRSMRDGWPAVQEYVRWITCCSGVCEMDGLLFRSMWIDDLMLRVSKMDDLLSRSMWHEWPAFEGYERPTVQEYVRWMTYSSAVCEMGDLLFMSIWYGWSAVQEYVKVNGLPFRSMWMDDLMLGVCKMDDLLYRSMWHGWPAVQEYVTCMTCYWGVCETYCLGVWGGWPAVQEYVRWIT